MLCTIRECRRLRIRYKPRSVARSSSIWAQVGRRIRRIRFEHGLSQDQLAERAHLSISLVSKLEAGHKGAKLESLIKLANALDVTLAELLPHPIGDTAPPKVSPTAGARTVEPKPLARAELSGEHKRLIERTRQLSKADLRILSYLAQLMGEGS